MGISYRFLDKNGSAIEMGKMYTVLLECCQGDERQANICEQILFYTAISFKTVQEAIDVRKDTDEQFCLLMTRLRDHEIALHSFDSWRV